MKHNRKAYKHWVVVAGKIVGGNEYRGDAQELAQDINSTSDRWPAKVYARPGLKKLGLDPDVNASWGEPSEWLANPARKKLPPGVPPRHKWQRGERLRKSPLYVSLGAVPNFDFRNWPEGSYGARAATVRLPMTWACVDTLSEARDKVLWFINKYELGGGNFVGGEVRDYKGDFVAMISYNGRVWDRDIDTSAGFAERNEILLPNPATLRPGVEPPASLKATRSNSYYHVTDRQDAESIVREGFRGGYGDAGFGVYLWTDYHDAVQYAEKGGWDKSLTDPVVLWVVSERPLPVEPDPSWENPEDYENVAWVELDENREPTWRPEWTDILANVEKPKRRKAKRTPSRNPALKGILQSIDAVLVGHKDVDHGPGTPYYPSVHRHFLYRTPKRVHGKQFFLTIDGTSRTWLSDKQAAEWMMGSKANPAGLPPSVERYVRETRAQNPNMLEPQVWAIAWSRYCKYKAPGSKHCRLSRTDYFPGRQLHQNPANPHEAQYTILKVGNKVVVRWDTPAYTVDGEWMGTDHGVASVERGPRMDGTIGLAWSGDFPGRELWRIEPVVERVMSSGQGEVIRFVPNKAKQNPAKIIPFPVGGRDGRRASTEATPIGPPIDVRMDSAFGLTEALAERFGDKVITKIVESGDEFFAAFEPWSVMVFPGSGADENTSGELAALGVIIDENGGYVPWYSTADVRRAIEAPPAVAPPMAIPDGQERYRMFVANVKHYVPAASIRRGTGSIDGSAVIQPPKSRDWTAQEKQTLKEMLGYSPSNYESIRYSEQRDLLRKWAASGTELLPAPAAKAKAPSVAKPKIQGVAKEFQEAFDHFMEVAQSIVDKNWSTYKNLPRPILSAEDGRRYVRITRKDDPASESGSAHAFVDKTNGDILKPASWKTPAKGARGNIFVSGFDKWLGPYGPAYLR